MGRALTIRLIWLDLEEWGGLTIRLIWLDLEEWGGLTIRLIWRNLLVEFDVRVPVCSVCILFRHAKSHID
jgi:hypothetical protein